MKNYSLDINILLADDDKADCLLFKDALEELPINAFLTIVENGEQVIEVLTNAKNNLPDVLFLDLNMPRKNGFATLGEIKRNSELYKLPIVIFSTSSEVDTVKKVLETLHIFTFANPLISLN
jgi:CheY-like chemotaxis protein